jgi:hypothetical protein
MSEKVGGADRPRAMTEALITRTGAETTDRELVAALSRPGADLVSQVGDVNRRPIGYRGGNRRS